MRPRRQPFGQQRDKPPHGPSLAQRHWPLLQVLVFEPHWLPQLPQLFRSLLSVLQPPLQQVWLALHALPQLPQLASSLLVLTHAPLQQVWPLLQLLSLVHTQRPDWQLKLLGQA
jgi:hypothetical protein